jgi:hypothetical protein
MDINTAQTIAQHKDDDGRFFADRIRVKRAPIIRPSELGKCGLSMGWTVAEAASSEAAIAIADALNVKYEAEIAGIRATIDEALALCAASRS